MGEKFAVLVHEENYAFVMDHFCDSVDLTAFPNSSGVKVTQSPRWLKVTYRGGCPESDPSFAQKLDINGSAACRRQTCLSTSWLAALRDNFKTRIKHLRLRDLFFRWRRAATSPTSREAYTPRSTRQLE